MFSTVTDSMTCGSSAVPPHLRHDGVHVLREDDTLEAVLLAGRAAVLLLDVVLCCSSHQDDQHGLTRHVHLKTASTTCSHTLRLRTRNNHSATQRPLRAAPLCRYLAFTYQICGCLVLITQLLTKEK